MLKFKIYFDKDEETKWLNDMATQGWAMSGFFAGFYRFEKCEKGQWKYQVDLGEKFGTTTEDYREFMSDAGIEIVQNWGYWIFLRKHASDGEFVLYSDVESSIEHYTKILTMFKVVAVVEIICLFIEILAALNGFAIGWVYACVIGALTFAVINATVKTKNVIRELQGRKSGMDVEKDGREVSPFLPAGLLLNACALVVSNSETLSDPLKRTVQIAAIVLMLIGVARTAAKRR